MAKELYHGSKNGIHGNINPTVDRESCDFGKGFYTGDNPNQPMGLIANWDNSIFYTLNCNITGLKVKEFGATYSDNIDWELYVAYNRGRLDTKYEILNNRYLAYNNYYDIIGAIADDCMFRAINEFFDGNISDLALIEALKFVDLGNQYLFKTPYSCNKEHLMIIESRHLEADEIVQADEAEKQRIKSSKNLIDTLKIMYRHSTDCKYFDEIIKEYTDAKDNI